MTLAAADLFMQRLVLGERRFYQPGVGYDASTGMTFDSHRIGARTGRLKGPRRFSAASKESLHIALLVKALAGDPTARLALTPDPKRPDRAVNRALAVLEKKIGSYERFDREFPGFGGFLPWYRLDSGHIAPTPDWVDRVPGLDNGQLAWSLYYAANTLRQLGHSVLARRYQARLDRMTKNVVRIFYDPKARKMRAEAKLVRGSSAPAEQNEYENNQPQHFLDDAYEGTLLCHFADLMGDWSGAPSGKEAIWSQPRPRPVNLRLDGRSVTVVQGNWFSSHEEWGFLVLPFRDVPIADSLFRNAQRVRTSWSASRGLPGLFASVHAPTSGDEEPVYMAPLGIQAVAKEKVARCKPIFAPYAAFPLALVDKPVFASWLERMTTRTGVLGPYGMADSFSADGRRAPILTWDGKALPLLAWMGGTAKEVGALLRKDGLYPGFLRRAGSEYQRFNGIEASALPLSLPTR